MRDWAASLDHEPIARRARSLWERACRCVAGDRSEIYLKHARRVRLVADPAFGRVRVSESFECGTAFRWTRNAATDTSHVAIGGEDPLNLERAIGAARTRFPAVAAPMAGVDLATPSERLDLDPELEVPDERSLAEWMGRKEGTDWVEVGATVEILVGPGGWTAIRFRQRSAALIGDPLPLLLARRGFDILGMSVEETHSCAERSAPGAGWVGRVALGPAAASAVIVPLAARFHGGQPLLGGSAGPGWLLADEPSEKDGLAGGSFDDAGFPTASRTLAHEGRIVAGLDGPGTYWRRSYRDVPRSLPSTLVLRPGPADVDVRGATVVPSCRVLPLSQDLWILEPGGSGGGRFRASPRSLIEGCLGSVGAPSPTAEGVITPTLLFENVEPA